MVAAVSYEMDVGHNERRLTAVALNVMKRAGQIAGETLTCMNAKQGSEFAPFLPAVSTVTFDKLERRAQAMTLKLSDS